MIKKRGKGYGVRIYRGGGRWEWIGTYPTRRDARAAEAAAMSVNEAGVRPQTVGEYAETWLVGYEQRVKRSTYDRASVAVRRVTAHELANVPIDSVPLAVADSFVAAHAASVQTAESADALARPRSGCSGPRTPRVGAPHGQDPPFPAQRGVASASPRRRSR